MCPEIAARMRLRYGVQLFNNICCLYSEKHKVHKHLMREE